MLWDALRSNECGAESALIRCIGESVSREAGLVGKKSYKKKSNKIYNKTTAGTEAGWNLPDN